MNEHRVTRATDSRLKTHTHTHTPSEDQDVSDHHISKPGSFLFLLFQHFFISHSHFLLCSEILTLFFVNSNVPGAVRLDTNNALSFFFLYSCRYREETSPLEGLCNKRDQHTSGCLFRVESL